MTGSIQGIAAIVLLSEHLVSENASTTETASLLAIFVADDGAQLTTFGKK